MELIKVSTQEIITLKQLKSVYRNVLFPSDLTNANLSDYDAAVVLTDPTPAYDPETQVLELSAPQLIGGKWRRTWTVAAKRVESIGMAQCRLELYARGLLGQVIEAVSSLGGEAQIEWEYRTEVRRDSALVSQMAEFFQMSDKDLDDFFMEAAQR